MTDEWNRTLATQGAIALFGNVAHLGLGFLFTVIVTSLVAPDVYGSFSLALGIVLLLSKVASLNLPRSIDYYLPKHLEEGRPDRAGAMLLRVGIISTLTSAVGMGLLILFRHDLARLFDTPSLADALLVMSVIVVLMTLNEVAVRSFIAVKALKYKVLTKDTALQCGKILAATVLLLLGYDLLGLTLSYVAGFALSITIGGLFLYRRVLPELDAPTFDVPTRNIVSYSLPLLFAGIIYSVVGQIDFFVIGYLSDSSDVGIYKVGFLLASTLAVIRTSLASVLKPMVAESKHSGPGLGARYRTATRWIVILTIPPAIVLLLLPEPYIVTLFDPAYGDASLAVSILAAGYLCNALLAPEVIMLEGLGYTRVMLLNSSLLVSLNFLLDVLFVTQFGFVGAALGSALAMTAVSAVGVLEVRYLTGHYPYSGTFVRALVAGVLTLGVAAVVAVVAGPHLLTAVLFPPLVIAVFAATIVLTGGVTDEDRQLVVEVASSVGGERFGRS